MAVPYRFVEDAFTADVGFIASGATLAECFRAAADATLEVMLANPAVLRRQERRAIHVEHADLDLALLNFLEELIYFKDTEQLLLRVAGITVEQYGDRWVVDASTAGEPIDPARHELSADVKAVTLHRLDVQRRDGEWQATVVLDI